MVPSSGGWRAGAIGLVAAAMAAGGCGLDRYELGPEIGRPGSCELTSDQRGYVDGERGALDLWYASGATEGTIDTWIATGANLALHPYGTLAGVESSSPDVIAIERMDDSELSLHAAGDGYAELEVAVSWDDGTMDRDTFPLEVATATDARASHCCTDEAHALYLVDDEVRLPVELRNDSEDEVLVGWGASSLTSSNPDVVRIVDEGPDATGARVVTGSTPGTATVSPAIDGRELTMELVTPDAIEGVSVLAVEPEMHGDRLTAFPFVESTPVCTSALQVRYQSPRCMLENRNLRLGPAHGLTVQTGQVVELVNGGASKCSFDVTLLTAAGAVLATRTVTVRFHTGGGGGGGGGDDDDIFDD